MANVLGRLHAQADKEDELAAQRVHRREQEIGGRLAQAQRYALYGEAPQAVAREVGRFLYVLALGAGARRIVEFGSSLGVSTIYLAAALRDGGGGALITTECHEHKATLARRNLVDASLADLVELRSGDALDTLANPVGPIDLLFLDGRNDLYLPVLRVLEEHLSPAALVVAHLSADDPDLYPYLEHVRDAGSEYLSMTSRWMTAWSFRRARTGRMGWGVPRRSPRATCPRGTGASSRPSSESALIRRSAPTPQGVAHSGRAGPARR